MTIRTKDDAQRVLRHVSDDKRFYCHDGTILNNLHDLKNELAKMSIHTYNHHVTDEKNDFTRWIRDVLGDDKLAKDLAKCTGSKEALSIVSERISWLQAKI